MSKAAVLITSATSRTGSGAAKLLLAQGQRRIRLAARDPSKLADLAAQGAEVVTLDPTSAESVAQVCKGVDMVYHILPPFAGGNTQAVMLRNLLQAATAESSTIKHITYLSSAETVDPEQAGFKPVHNHYENEQELQRSGIPFTILRPAWFYENQVSYNSESIRRTGEFKTSAGDGVWTTVAIRDIAAAAVAVMSYPHLHAGKIYTLTTEAVTDDKVAEMISKVTGQTVKHVNLTPEEHAELIRQGLGGMPAATKEEYARTLVTLDWEKRSSLFTEVHPDLEELIGRKGISLEAFLAEHADAFKRLPESAS